MDCWGIQVILKRSCLSTVPKWVVLLSQCRHTVFLMVGVKKRWGTWIWRAQIFELLVFWVQSIRFQGLIVWVQCQTWVRHVNVKLYSWRKYSFITSDAAVPWLKGIILLYFLLFQVSFSLETADAFQSRCLEEWQWECGIKWRGKPDQIFSVWGAIRGLFQGWAWRCNAIARNKQEI